MDIKIFNGYLKWKNKETRGICVTIKELWKTDRKGMVELLIMLVVSTAGIIYIVCEQTNDYLTWIIVLFIDVLMLTFLAIHTDKRDIITSGKSLVKYRKHCRKLYKWLKKKKVCKKTQIM